MSAFVATLLGVAIYARRSGVDGPMIERELVALGWFAAPVSFVVAR